MTYNKTTWSDRVVQYPMQFTIAGTVSSGGTVTLTPNEGTITTAGTPITSANMNNLENGVSNVDSRLTTVESAYVSKNANNQVNGNFGLNIAPTYGIHQLGGSARLQALTTPSAPSVSTVGATGSSSYTYYVVAKDRNGFQTVASSGTTISTGNATLSASNYNTISWTAVPGAVYYDVLKGTTGTALATGLTATTVNDTGQATTGYTAPTRNATADLTIDGNITSSGDIHAENGHLYVGGAGHDIIFNAGRPNTSNIFWNANSGVDYGLSVNVDGQTVLTLNSDGSMYGAKNPFAIKALQDLSLNTGGSGWLYLTSPNGRIYLKQGDSNGVYVTNIAQSAFLPINASAFNVNSDRDMKKNIKPFSNNAESLVNSSTVYNYNYNSEQDTDPRHTGLIMQEAPSNVIAANGVGVDIYAMTAVLWKAVQELSAKIQSLQSQSNGQSNSQKPVTPPSAS